MSVFDAQTRQAAYFEAGQVIGACLEGFRVEHVVCCPAAGEIWCDVAEPILPERGLLLNGCDRAGATALVRALLSGPAAQEIHSFGSCSEELRLSDPDLATEMCFWRAAGLARRLRGGTTTVPRLWHQVRENLNHTDVWTALVVIADLLMERGELTGREVEELAHGIFVQRD